MHKSDYTGDGVPVINPMHIVDSQLVPSRAMTITDKAAAKLSEFKLKPGEVIIGRRGDMGRCAVVRDYQMGWLCGTGSMVVRPGTEMDADFLQRVLSSPSVISAIEDSSVGTTMINLNQSTLRKLIIQAPTVNEQRAIAAALSDVDALLAKQGQLIAKKQGLKQAAMQQLLTGQTRLPGFSGDWEVKKLGDVCNLLKGSGLSKNLINASGLRKCILYGELFTTYGQVIQDVVSRTSSSEGRMSEAGDVLIPGSTTTDGIDLAIASALLESGVALGGDINIVRCDIKSGFIPQFLANYLTHIKKREIAERAQGTTIVHLYGRDLRDLTVHRPAVAEQTAIAIILSDMDTEIAALEERQTKTRALKQGMMQELLTGKTRLV